MTILPEVLDCNEFVNADIIAYGLSPFNLESVAIQAGRMMLKRIDELLSEEVSFAIETTLATKSYTSLINKAKQKGYEVVLLFFWLDNVQQAINRVSKRVSEGGHNIPESVIERRYYAGVRNLFQIYMDICDVIRVYNNSDGKTSAIFKYKNKKLDIVNTLTYSKMIEL